MINYSQNEEQTHILQYFKHSPTGMLVDIGTNDGITFSNSRALIQMGWGAMLVEPDFNAYQKLQTNVAGNQKVMCFNLAIGTETGAVPFFESGPHVSAKDTGLLSTLVEGELKRWEGTTNTFTKRHCNCFTWDDFCKLMPLKMSPIDFITIDAEGMDVAILKQIDLTRVRLLCIEHNGNEVAKAEILEYCARFRMRNVVYQNGENILIGR